jgi:uncharacterized protein
VNPTQRRTIGEVVIDGVARAIQINERAGRFEIRVDGHVAITTFRVFGSVLSLLHTEVPEALRGKHIADALARGALEYARDHGMTIKPFCPFVARYITRHTEFQTLVDPSFAGSDQRA